MPWSVPNGMDPGPSDPEALTLAVKRAFDAGADSVLASREYNEMRFSSLEAFGNGIGLRIGETKVALNWRSAYKRG